MKDKKILEWAMRMAICDNSKPEYLKENKDYIKTEITYEQMLNMVFNPDSDVVYKSQEVLEQDALTFIRTNILEESMWSDFKLGLVSTIKRLGISRSSVPVPPANGATVEQKKAWMTKIRQLVARDMDKAIAAAKNSPSELKRLEKKKLSLLKSVDKKINSIKDSGVKTSIGSKMVDYARRNPTKTAAAVVATAAGLYFLYKKLRNNGKSRKDAAAIVSSKAKNPKQKAKWAKISKEAAA